MNLRELWLLILTDSLPTDYAPFQSGRPMGFQGDMSDLCVSGGARQRKSRNKKAGLVLYHIQLTSRNLTFASSSSEQQCSDLNFPKPRGQEETSPTDRHGVCVCECIYFSFGLGPSSPHSVSISIRRAFWSVAAQRI